MFEEGTFWCDGCGVEITWHAQNTQGQHYCCAACFAGQRCECGARREIEDERRVLASAIQWAEREVG